MKRIEYRLGDLPLGSPIQFVGKERPVDAFGLVSAKCTIDPGSTFVYPHGKAWPDDTRVYLLVPKTFGAEDVRLELQTALKSYGVAFNAATMLKKLSLDEDDSHDASRYVGYLESLGTIMESLYRRLFGDAKSVVRMEGTPEGEAGLFAGNRPKKRKGGAS